MKGKVLIIDDEYGIRFTFEHFLGFEGYLVTTAENFDKALACIDAEDFDLVFADIILGGRTGIDFLREIRKRNLTTPVIMMTGNPDYSTASEAVRLGAYDYISKPLVKNDIIHVANLAIQYKQMNDRNEKYRANLEAVFRSVKDGIITFDENLTVVQFNDAARSICGLDDQAIGKKIDALDIPCRMICLKTVKETIRTTNTTELQRLECRHVNQPTQVVSITTSPLSDGQRSYCGAVMVVHDETRLADLERNLGELRQFHKIVGKSEKMQQIYSLIETLADVPTAVLITGESGTGKELVAEALHFNGVRSEKPLVKVNCAALTENLLETELFGHVKGAFTGAIHDKAGRFQKANHGTIFLDEIGDISPAMQAKLLRVLQEKEFERVGDSTPIKVELRVVAATNRDLGERIKKGEFRADLFYRLKVIEIHLPALRERREDIPLLVEHFIMKLNKKLKRLITSVSEDVQTVLMGYPWPGNIRELEHVMEHAFILCKGTVITLEHLPPELRDSPAAQPPDLEAERDIILRALERTAGNKAKAARLLNMDRKTLYRKLERYGIDSSEAI